MRLGFSKIAILILVTSLVLTSKCKNNEIDKLKTSIHKNLLKNDKLRLEKDGIYKKFVSDSLTKKELKKKVRDLEIKVKNPIIAQNISFRPTNIKKIPDTVYIEKGDIIIKDYYPSKEEAFIEYIFTKRKDSIKSNFNFLEDVDINLVINETKLGVFESNIKAPNFIKLNEVEINMLPKQTVNKVKNFGFLLGAGLQKNTNNSSIILNTGVRYKKTYLQLQATTNQSIGFNITKEF